VSADVETITLPDGRVMPRAEFAAALARLTAPFPADQVEKLPKQLRSGDQDKGKCARGSNYSADGHYCGGWHARSMHLDYIGHAGITARLGEADPFWTWEPMGLTEAGTPLMNDDGMWIKLTVLGVTRYGYGDPGGKRGPNAVKEVIGDALRNAAMRHGVATYLWSKSEAAERTKSGAEEPAPQQAAPRAQAARPAPAPATPPAQADRNWKRELDATTDPDELVVLWADAVNAGLFVKDDGTPPELAFKARARAIAPDHNTPEEQA